VRSQRRSGACIPLLSEAEDFLLGGILALGESDEGLGSLAPFLVRCRHDCGSPSTNYADVVAIPSGQSRGRSGKGLGRSRASLAVALLAISEPSPSSRSSVLPDIADMSKQTTNPGCSTAGSSSASLSAEPSAATDAASALGAARWGRRSVIRDRKPAGGEGL
jgi:hypothetical protein